MNSFCINNIKADKANAISKHRQLRKIANLFRAIELCLVLILVSRFTTQLPLAVKNSGMYFRDLTVILVSPRFVFVVGNIIVITLFAKSGQFSAQDSSGKNSGTDFYEEFLQKSEKSQSSYRYEKQSLCEEKIVCVDSTTSGEVKHFRRSQSEHLKRVICEKPCKELRRSLTEKRRKRIDSGKELVKTSYPEDNMSNEEFRCTVEAFIARQRKFCREEEPSDSEDNMSNEAFRRTIEAFIARQKKFRREEEPSDVIY